MNVAHETWLVDDAEPTRALLRRRFILWTILITLLVWGLVDVRRRGVVDLADTGKHKTDLTVYTVAGAAFFDGRKPYEVTNIRGWGYLYPPLFAMLMAPLYLLPETEQVFVWYLLSLLAAWGCIFEIRRLAAALVNRLPGDYRCVSEDSPDAWPSWIWYAAGAGVLLPALNCLQRGQVGILLLYLLLVGLHMTVEGRTLRAIALGGLVLAASIVLKVTPLLPVMCLCTQMLLAAWFHTSRAVAIRRAVALPVGVVGGLVVLALLVPAGLIGWQQNVEHLHSWWSLVATKAEDPGYDNFAGDSHSVRNQSLLNAAHRFGNWAAYQAGFGPNDRIALADSSVLTMPMDAPLAKRILLGARLLLVLSLSWPVWTTARRQDRLGQAATFGLACAATLVAAPIARGHYFMLLLPALVFVPAWLYENGQAKAAQRMAWSAAGLVLAHYLLMSVTGRIGLLGIGISIWYLTAVVLVGRGKVLEPAAVWLPVGSSAGVRRLAA